MERKDKHKRFKILLHKCELRHHEADMLSPFGVSSIKDLQETDLDSLIERLETIKLSKSDANDTPKHIRKLRSTAIMLCEDILGQRIVGRAWTNLNQFLLQPRIAGKLLTDLDETEMKALNNKLRSIIRKRNTNARIQGQPSATFSLN